MTRIAYITDIHLANRPPANRQDDYNATIFGKLRWVAQECKRRKIRYLIIGGDLAHSYKPEDELIYRFVALMQKYELEVYYIYGNHDIQGGNTKYVNRTNFGLLSQHKWFHLLDNNPVQLKGVVLAGYDYNAKKECEEHWEFPKSEHKGIRILVVHAMIVAEKSILCDGMYKQINVESITTNADILLCGHYHLGFAKPVRLEMLNREALVVNPGSIARIDANQSQKTHGPRVAVITVSGGKYRVELVVIPHKPTEEVFDCTELESRKETKEDKNNFVLAMQDLMAGKVMGGCFADQLHSTLKDPPKELREAVTPPVIRLCLNKVRKYL